MNLGPEAFQVAVLIWATLAVLSGAVLFFIPAPYGRYADAFTGRTIPSRWGWLVMESPAVVVFAATFWTGDHRDSPVSVVFLLLWLSHYAQRAFVYPFLLRTEGRRMPLYIAALAFSFNLVNGYLNGRFVFSLAGRYPDSWLRSWQFLLGAALFAGGYGVNRWSDNLLRRLRAAGAGGYSVPRGGLFRWVSCPNYLGESVLWIGWALATWSPAGLAFALWTLANLVPRARSHHRWYRETFPDYPAERRALVPGLW